MPAMQQLQSDEHFAGDVDDLAHYVRYLSIRGEFERRLWLDVAFDFDDKTFRSAAEADSLEHFPPQLRDAFYKTLGEVVSRWESVVTTHEIASEQLRSDSNSAEATATTDDASVFQWPEDLLDPGRRDAMRSSAERGKSLFHGELTACSQCHGVGGDGRGRLVDYDEWTKDWTIRAGIDPRERSQWKPLKQFGLLKPVVDPPRNLKLGVFRGGAEPHQIFDRIANGIDGTPMPAAPRAATSPVGLSDQQIWDLVNYVQSLAYEDDS